MLGGNLAFWHLIKHTKSGYPRQVWKMIKQHLRHGRQMTLEQCLLCNIWEKLITTSPTVCGFKHKDVISKGFLPYDVIQKLLQFGQSHRKVSFQGTQQVLGLLLRLHLTQFKMPLLALNILSCKFSDKYSYEYETKEPLKEDHSFLLKLAVQGRGRGLLHKLQNAWKKGKDLAKSCHMRNI